MKKFLCVALPVIAAVGTCAVLAVTHKDEAHACLDSAKKWGTRKLDNAYIAARKYAEKYDLCPEDDFCE